MEDSPNQKIKLSVSDPASGDRPKPLWRRIWDPLSVFLAVIALVDFSKQLFEWAEIIHRVAQRYATIRESIFSYLPIQIPVDWHNIVVLGSVTFTAANVGYYRRTGKNLMKEVAVTATFPIWTAINAFLKFLEIYDVSELLRSKSPPLFRFASRIRPYLDGLKPYAARIREQTDRWLKGPALFEETVEVVTALFATKAMNTRYVSTTLGCSISLAAFGFIGFGLWLVSELVDSPYLLFFNGMAVFAFLGGILVAWRWVLLTASVFTFVLITDEIYIHLLT